MIDEPTFRRESDRALHELKQSLFAAEEAGGFEAEENNGVLNILFEDQPGSKFVLTPQTPVRQLWISAQSTSFKLDFDPEKTAFILPKTGEALKPLIERLLREFLADPSISLT